MIKGEINSVRNNLKEKVWHKILNIILCLSYFYFTLYLGKRVLPYLIERFPNSIFR